jgi:hypothetical protein
MAKYYLTQKSCPFTSVLKTSQRFFLCFLRFNTPLVDADVSSKSMLMIK